MIVGKIYGDSKKKFRDGHRFSTALVEETVDRGDYYLIKTLISEWILYKKYQDKSKGDISV